MDAPVSYPGSRLERLQFASFSGHTFRGRHNDLAVQSKVLADQWKMIMVYYMATYNQAGMINHALGMIHFHVPTMIKFT